MERKILVVASGNKGKIKEISDMLPEYKVVGYKDMGLDFEIEETGSTFYENSLVKAKTVSDALNLPVLADDSGLCVDVLGGAPGIYSARYAGDGNDEHNNDKLLSELKDKTDRRAHFTCCMVIYFPNGTVKTFTGITEGEILKERTGTNGFGYDPIFYSYDLKKSFGLATKEEKNSVSHRGRALKGIKDELN